MKLLKSLFLLAVVSLPLCVSVYSTINTDEKCLEFVGYDVNSDIHYGDWGVQMAQIISYIEKENINQVEKILEKIEIITINEQYLSVKATVEENLISNKLDLINKSLGTLILIFPLLSRIKILSLFSFKIK